MNPKQHKFKKQFMIQADPKRCNQTLGGRGREKKK